MAYLHRSRLGELQPMIGSTPSHITIEPVLRADLTRFTLREALWDAWCHSVRVLIKVLADLI